MRCYPPSSHPPPMARYIPGKGICRRVHITVQPNRSKDHDYFSEFCAEKASSERMQVTPQYTSEAAVWQEPLAESG